MQWSGRSTNLKWRGWVMQLVAFYQTVLILRIRVPRSRDSPQQPNLQLLKMPLSIGTFHIYHFYLSITEIFLSWSLLVIFHLHLELMLEICNLVRVRQKISMQHHIVSGVPHNHSNCCHYCEKKNQVLSWRVCIVLYKGNIQ